MKKKQLWKFQPFLRTFSLWEGIQFQFRHYKSLSLCLCLSLSLSRVGEKHRQKRTTKCPTKGWWRWTRTRRSVRCVLSMFCVYMCFLCFSLPFDRRVGGEMITSYHRRPHHHRGWFLSRVVVWIAKPLEPSFVHVCEKRERETSSLALSRRKRGRRSIQWAKTALSLWMCLSALLFCSSSLSLSGERITCWIAT